MQTEVVTQWISFLYVIKESFILKKPVHCNCKLHQDVKFTVTVHSDYY